MEKPILYNFSKRGINMHQFPDGYRPLLNQHDTEKAIKAAKD